MTKKGKKNVERQSVKAEETTEDAGSQEVDVDIMKLVQPTKAAAIQSTDIVPEAKLESSTKQDKIELICGHPYSSSEYIDFKVEGKPCVEGWHYNLDSNVHGKHVIYRHNSKKRAVLTHKKYTTTLKQWLDEQKNKDKWCPDYQVWEVNRPKEEARQIIQGILRAVNELHSNDCFHGRLYHPENYAIHYDESVIGGDHKEIKRIFLVHENVKLNKHFGVPTIDKIDLGKKKDIDAMFVTIFKKILPDSSSKKCEPDLNNLCELIKQCKGNPECWKYVVNHPSLWHWKSRLSYIVHVRMQYKVANQKTRQSMDEELRKIDVNDWKEQISDTLLTKVLNYREGYGSTPNELLRFLRNVRVHYKEHVDDNEELEWKYLNEQFLEHKITEVSKLFLVDLYQNMCNLDI